ncbi:hypothetical protein Mapa_005373 [Marchantia paleacea]|nr:hypothetical protein Mapa_005373 [Marchantia paleacea]
MSYVYSVAFTAKDEYFTFRNPCDKLHPMFCSSDVPQLKKPRFPGSGAGLFSRNRVELEFVLPGTFTSCKMWSTC